MRHRLRELLACPECGQWPLALEVFERCDVPASVSPGFGCRDFCVMDGPGAKAGSRPCGACYAEDVVEGLLECRHCDRRYPIIGGIPRFTGDVVSDYPDFFARHAGRLGQAPPATSSDGQHKTRRSFGFQWLRYEVTRDQENEEHFYRRTGTTPEAIRGQLFFEAGCGMGRYLEVLARHGQAEAVGLDLSLAVNRAREQNRHSPLVHVVQGNIMKLPFRPGVFDHVYSIGVLHHTPSTERAFRNIAGLARPGGRVSVWVYHVWRWPELKGFAAAHATVKGWVTDGLRAITTRLPLPVLHYLCYLAVPYGWLQIQINRLPQVFRVLLSPILLINVSVHPEWKIRLLDTFDWYSPEYQWKHTVPEVAGWFREEGLEDIVTEGFPVTVRGRRPGTSLS